MRTYEVLIDQATSESIQKRFCSVARSGPAPKRSDERELFGLKHLSAAWPEDLGRCDESDTKRFSPLHAKHENADMEMAYFSSDNDKLEAGYHSGERVISAMTSR